MTNPEVTKVVPFEERGTTPCLHGRMIDEVLTKGGNRTGTVCCLECNAVFDDPYHGLK